MKLSDSVYRFSVAFVSREELLLILIIIQGLGLQRQNACTLRTRTVLRSEDEN